MLFNDFYLRLIPSDSSQLVPLSALSLQQTGTSIVRYFQMLDKVSIQNELPSVKDNGLAQRIPIRDHINYKIDVSLKFFCTLNDVPGAWFYNLQNLKISVSAITHDKKNLPLYVANIPVSCMKNDDSISLPENKQLSTSRMKSFNTEWLNEIKIDDVIEFTPSDDYQGLSVIFTIPNTLSEHGHETINVFGLLMNPESSLNFRMNFNQGLRNLMLRYRIITYIVGTVIFHIITTLLFVVTAILAFYVTNRNLVSNNIYQNEGKKFKGSSGENFIKLK